jgi:hypothetical protein
MKPAWRPINLTIPMPLGTLHVASIFAEVIACHDADKIQHDPAC